MWETGSLLPLFQAKSCFFCCGRHSSLAGPQVAGGFFSFCLPSLCKTARIIGAQPHIQLFMRVFWKSNEGHQTFATSIFIPTESFLLNSLLSFLMHKADRKFETGEWIAIRKNGWDLHRVNIASLALIC